MSWIGWPTLLFSVKWVLLGLIYLVLFILLVAVRREMSMRMKESQRLASAAPGRLRVLKPGADTNIPNGMVIHLPPETRLGTQPDNDIVLGDRYISGHHARMHWDGDTWWVEDLGSRNGTYLDGRSCPAHQPQSIAPGNNLQLGDMIFEMLD